MTQKGKPNKIPVSVHELEVRARNLTGMIAELEAERARIYVAIALAHRGEETP